MTGLQALQLAGVIPAGKIAVGDAELAGDAVGGIAGLYDVLLAAGILRYADDAVARRAGVIRGRHRGDHGRRRGLHGCRLGSGHLERLAGAYRVAVKAVQGAQFIRLHVVALSDAVQGVPLGDDIPGLGHLAGWLDCGDATSCGRAGSFGWCRSFCHRQAGGYHRRISCGGDVGKRCVGCSGFG